MTADADRSDRSVADSRVMRLLASRCRKDGGTSTWVVPAQAAHGPPPTGPARGEHRIEPLSVNPQTPASTTTVIPSSMSEFALRDIRNVLIAAGGLAATRRGIVDN